MSSDQSIETTNPGTSTPDPAIDRLPLSSSSGGVSNTKLTPWNPTFEELCQEFDRPPDVGGKDGSYFLRGPCKEGESTRDDANIEFASVIILDGDSSFDPDTGEVTEGAPAQDIVHAALKALDISHCLFTTYSHGQEGKGHRFRVIIPAVTNDKGELKGVLEWIFHLLIEQGCCLVNVKENGAWSQPWYFPRLASKDSEYHCLVHSSSKELDVAAALAWYKDQEIAQSEIKIAQAVKKSKPRDPSSAYARFNNEHGTPKGMLQTLKGNGYTLQSTSLDDNGEPMYRLLSPHSTSGSPGIVVFCGDDGGWRVYSHHGAQEPLSREGDPVQVCDAFDLFRILEHGGDQQMAITAWERSGDVRPLIQIQGGALPHNLTTAIKALAQLDPPRVYQRAHALSRIAHLKEAAETEGCTIPAGTAHIVQLQRSVLTVILSEVIRWEAFKKKEWRLSNPCQMVVSGLIDGFGMWESIPPLLGISEAPILRADGTLLSTPGYDCASQLYVEGNAPEIHLPDKISLEEAQEAARLLLEPFAEFPFVDPDLDRAVLLASLITLALRPQLTTAPLFCISATTPGTGKGLLVEASNLLVRGRDAATMPPVQGRGGEEEMRKRITALLSQGIASINMDNWTKAIGGESMNALLTTTEWTDRVLGRSVSVTLPARCTIMATGNNLSVKGDMTRRAVAILLDAKVERPELRTFKEKKLPDRVLRDRGVLLPHLFTILKGYQQAGSPDSDQKPLGRFEDWTGRVCGPIRWLGYPDPLDSQERLRQLDPEADRVGCLMEAWWDFLGTGWYTAGDIIKAVDDPPDGNKQKTEREAMKTALRDVAPEGRDSYSSRLLGWYLMHHEGRIVEEFRLERKPRKDSKTRKAQQYRVINTRLLDGK